jgi:hypothetical protein
MEDFLEEIVRSVFPPESVAMRASFIGADGTTKEKIDAAIPNMVEPRILIEAKAFGATGSKQTDVLGDFSRIIQRKRHDTVLLLVTDGITWRRRPNDLRKLIALQNEGKIQRIYTTSMATALKEDLIALKAEMHL